MRCVLQCGSHGQIFAGYILPVHIAGFAHVAQWLYTGGIQLIQFFYKPNDFFHIGLHGLLGSRVKFEPGQIGQMIDELFVYLHKGNNEAKNKGMPFYRHQTICLTAKCSYQSENVKC